MKWLLSLVLVLLAVGTSAGVEAQLRWDMTPPAPNPPAPKQTEPESKEVATWHPSWDQVKSPAVIEAERRVKRNRIALGVSAVPLALGAIIATAGALGSLNQTGTNPDTSGQDGALYAGSALVGAGAVWMITSGVVLGVRKRQLRQAQGASRRELRDAR